MEPQDVKHRVTLTPAERMLMIEQCETLGLAASKYRKAIEDGRISEMMDLFYEITEPYEYLGKVLSTKVQKAMVEALREAADG